MNYTAEDVKALQLETGEGLLWCKEELKRRNKEEEKKEMLAYLHSLDLEYGTHKILQYLISRD